VTDRVVRDEILESERWLSLPDNSCRVAYCPVLLLNVDDFGNIEGSIFRLCRLFARSRLVPDDRDAERETERIVRELEKRDMVRRYTGPDGRELLHLPRLRPHRQYLSRKVAPSPWDDAAPLGKIVRKQGHAKNVDATSQRRSSDVAEGVGVGVGVGVGSRGKVVTSKESKDASHLMSGTEAPDAFALEPPTSKPKKPKVNGAHRDTEADRKAAELRQMRADAVSIIEFLNRKTGRQFRPGKENVGFIVARLKGGATVEQCRAVIAVKSRKWAHDERMSEFLRPATLFNATKFAQYLGELPATSTGATRDVES
jgi:uncharacterized phage protein (TIGR02220 family)